MADDKSGREKQARDADQRQRERAIASELERSDETEPPVEGRELGALETELEEVTFPATGKDLVAEVGHLEIESEADRYTVEELVPAVEAETYDSPDAVRVQVERPTIAAAMKRILEAAKTVPNTDLGWSQRKAYERTFRELAAIDPDDDDEGIENITEWVVDRIHEKERIPGSRDVRRQAAKFCRSNGYQVRNDEWLGI